MTVQEIEKIKEELKQNSHDLKAMYQKVYEEDEEIIEQPDHGYELLIRRALHSVHIVVKAQWDTILDLLHNSGESLQSDH